MYRDLLSGVHLPTAVLRKKNYPRSASLTFDSACSLYRSFRAWPKTQQKVLGQDSCQEELDLGRRTRSCQLGGRDLAISWVRSWAELGRHNLGTLGKLGEILGKLVKILGRNLVQELFAGNCQGIFLFL